ncbi:hypothetical protein BC628DRAFT_140151 [Trametes gibbosa]|nr:hypothetical protein BC628DRAFT_140151 [Trametes gibbosa]
MLSGDDLVCVFRVLVPAQNPCVIRARCQGERVVAVIHATVQLHMCELYEAGQYKSQHPRRSPRTILQSHFVPTSAPFSPILSIMPSIKFAIVSALAALCVGIQAQEYPGYEYPDYPGFPSNPEYSNTVSPCPTASTVIQTLSPTFTYTYTDTATTTVAPERKREARHPHGLVARQGIDTITITITLTSTDTTTSTITTSTTSTSTSTTSVTATLTSTATATATATTTRTLTRTQTAFATSTVPNTTTRTITSFTTSTRTATVTKTSTVGETTVMRGGRAMRALQTGL